ncbi:MAG: tetratricopeptide repeat protein [Pseudomonadota bacterium]
MTRRTKACRLVPLVGAVTAALLNAGVAFAQSNDAPNSAAPGQVPKPTERPTAELRTDDSLDSLFDRLKKARSQEDAKAINHAIQVRWLESGSDTIDLLMRRAMKAMETKDYPLSLDLLDAVIDLRPDYPEGWNKRATVHYLMEDYGRSIGDIEQTLKLEPRHFGALAGLGSIFRRLGREEEALKVFEQTLAIHPRLESIQKAYSDLIEELEGRGI